MTNTFRPFLYDTHAHLDDAKLYPDIDGVLQRAGEAGIGYINTIGCTWKSSLMAVHIAEKYQDSPVKLFAAVGIHPSDSAGMDAALLERLYALTSSPKCVAWGEIGLDYHYDAPTREEQKRHFIEQLDAAKQAGLPIIIHDREAHQDTLDILKKEKACINGGVMHCFSGSWEMARECLRMGLHISFAGPLTFSNARSLPEVAAKVPADCMLVETDSPYLAPHPFRGQCNESAKVLYTAQKLAQFRNQELDEIIRITTENGKRLFAVEE